MAAELGNLKIGLGVDTKGLSSGLSSATKQINQFGSAIKAIAFAQLTQELGELVEKMSDLGIQSRNVRASFARFGESSFLLDDLRQATGGMVSDLQLMEQAIKAVNLGVSSQQLAKYFEFATVRAAETGESVDYLVTSIVNGVGRRSPLILDNLGIGVSRLGKNFRSSATAAQDVADIIDEELGKSALTVEDAIRPTQRLSAAWNNLIEEIADTAEGPAGQALLLLARFIEGTTELFKEWEDKGADALRKLKEEGYGTEGSISQLQRTLFETGVEIAKATEKVEYFKKRLEETRGDPKAFESITKQYTNASLEVTKLTNTLNTTTAALNILRRDTGSFDEEASNGMSDVSESIEEVQIGVKRLVRELGTLNSEIGEAIQRNFGEFLSGAAGLELGPNPLDKFKTESEENAEAIKETFIDLGQFFAEAATSLGEGLGDALSGEFDGSRFLASLSEFMSAFGKALIGIGFASDALKVAINNPFTAIAAGIGLVALAKVIKNTATSATSALGNISSGNSFAVAASQGDVGGFGRIQDQPDINIFLNGYELTKGLRRQNFYNDRTGG